MEYKIEVFKKIILSIVGVLVEFDRDTYTVMEGMLASILVILQGQSDIPVSVQFNTEDDTALGNGPEVVIQLILWVLKF